MYAYSKERQETISTIILSVAALTIAWCSYQSSLWNGIQTISLIDASTTDMHALEKTMIIQQQREIDATGTMNFLNAVIEKKKDRVDFYLHHSTPEMSHILSKWLLTDPLKNPNAPDHPMAMQEYKELTAKSLQEQIKLKEQSNELKNKGLQANQYSDNYVLYTVIFSMVMFINGVSSKIRNTRVLQFLSMASAFICLLGLVLMFATLPITKPG